MTPPPPIAPAQLEMWGGVECSVVRVGDIWRDQVSETGHARRGVDDIDRIAGLGLRAVRYPVLWERLTADPPGGNWAWQERQLAALHDRGVAVVAGLVHHGSGPAGTSLLDPHFPDMLARHAGQAAERFPDIAAWIPVNEPLTTARFSCLYGHWYPHTQEGDACLRALAVQCRAVLLAMRAIRAHQPGARFLHTEDLGRTFATAPLRAQAAYENDRRWLSLDLLCGRLGPGHPWRPALEAAGIPAHDLDELATGEAAPDLIGINHYATSDRFLDHRTELYPPHLRGGNGRDQYVDTEAVRVSLGDGLTGWEPRLREAWQRYGRPLVISEAHLGCEDPFEQVRWLVEAWQAAETLRAEGADVRAVTAWALFGLVDWNSMLRQRQGCYEAGVFDCAADPPRPTLLADAVHSLATRGRFDHPALAEPGWWRREERIHAALRHA